MWEGPGSAGWPEDEQSVHAATWGGPVVFIVPHSPKNTHGPPAAACTAALTGRAAAGALQDASGVAHRRAPASGFYTYNKHRETPGCAFRVLPVCPSDGQPGGRQLSGRGAAVCEGGAGHPQLRQRPHSRVHLMKKPPHIWRGVRGQVRDGAAHLWVLAKARTLVPAPHPPASAAVRGHVQRDGVCVVQNDGFPGEGLGMGWWYVKPFEIACRMPRLAVAMEFPEPAITATLEAGVGVIVQHADQLSPQRCYPAEVSFVDEVGRPRMGI
eukprot:CAMPEP_0177637722 /NCGR_PEP_ID=MMETSP0447-20121125/5118_1 /TAXON_ID=0 /ORGANISM="Stygamoeba regulata, Strain BSH-02190019" /LENGTH=268 /DNA_ID=CAMNT_0019139659 /DNA_START=254 /DNA_END=1062 /DNA_ORIENTATION=-